MTEFETEKKVVVKLPESLINFIMANGNLMPAGFVGEYPIINLPHWFIATENEGVYEMVFGRELTDKYASEFIEKCVKDQDLTSK